MSKSVKPILFSGPMVRALLDGRKTQTRRVLNPQPPDWCYQDQKPGYSCLTPTGSIEFRGRYVDGAGVDHGPASKFIKMPYAPGDLLWVRETWTATGTGVWSIANARRRIAPDQKILYAADGEDSLDGWWPSIHMPREFSRLTLRVTAVRVEQLQQISEADAEAEGCVKLKASGRAVYEPGDQYLGDHWPSCRAWFRFLWDSINEARAPWSSNPWVAAISFETIKANVDQVAA